MAGARLALMGLAQKGRDILRTQFLVARVLGSDCPEFRTTVARENLRTALVGTLGLLVINLAGILVYFPQLADPSLPQPYYNHLVSLYAMNVVFCLLYTPAAALVLTGRHPAGRLSRALSWLFLAWLFWLGVIFTINGQNLLDHLINYLFALVFVAAAFPMPALPSFALYAASYLALFFGLAVAQENHEILTASRCNAVTAGLFAYLVSRLLFARRVALFAGVKLIERQAKELAKERSGRRYDRFCLEFELTRREREILGMVLDGMTNQDIARKVFVSHDTVKKHVYHIFRKAEVGNRFELARYIENGEFNG
jgi:DNA-binding CsgD family transcriptional regulator